jgi:rhodanese-related sulfurtransferase
MRHSFIAFAFAICASLMAIAAPATAAETMTPKDAWTKIQAGELVLVDVRTQSEWRATGLAPGAVPLTMGTDGFYEELAKITAANPGKTLGLICAAGGRSTRVANELEARGLTGIVDVKAGMTGGIFGSGWLDEGLPVETWAE